MIIFRNSSKFHQDVSLNVLVRSKIFILSVITLFITISFTFLFGSCQPQKEVDLSSVNKFRGENIVLFGDCRDGYEIFEDIVNMITMLTDPPEGILMNGDLISDPGNLFQWYSFLGELKPFVGFAPYFPIVGNHDVDDFQSQQIMKDIFDLKSTYYTLRLLNIYIIVLDSHEPEHDGAIGPEQHDWLIEQLEHKPKDADFTMIIMHKPLFPVTNKGALWDRDYYHSLFLQYGVDIVIGGHEHLYARQEIDGITYITTGGAGAPLNEGFPGSIYHFVRLIQQSNGLYGQVIEPNGNIYEEFTIPKKR